MRSVYVLVLALVLGYLIESNYRRSLLLTGGDHIVFLQDPVSLGLLITAALFVAGSVLREVASARKAARRGQVGPPQS
jgi:putative tricarboxylic transport membrane protein